MRRFGRQGAVIPLDDVWTDVKGNYASTVAEVLTAADGHIYGLPFQFHSTVFFYRKSVFDAKGYQPPATWSDLLALCARMKSDGLAPLALGNRDLWPQLFVFDMLDLRLNGYAFHKGLLTGRERWTDPRLLKVFEAWRKLIPYYPPDYPDTTWQDAAAARVQKRAGMYFIGSFAVGQFETLDESIVDDLDCFEFPYFGNEWDGEHALLAGMDVWVIPAKASGGQASRPTATAYLEHWAKGSTQLLLHRQIHSYLPLARDVDPAQLAAPSRRIFELMGKAGHLFEGLDRAVTAGFPPEFWYYLREFAAEPGTDLTEFLRSIQQRWDDIGPDEVEPPLS
jgi:multiple sugar transport system substrate-binding protein